MVMGAKNSASHFQKVMSEVMDGLILQNLLVYIDDILVFADSEEKLVVVIREVFLRLRQFGIKIKPTKCNLFAKSILWCGMIIDEEGLKINPATVEAAQSMVPPSNAAQLQQFLASCNWVRNFIPAYAQLIAPLQDLLNTALSKAKRRNARTARKVSLSEAGWRTEHDESFHALKEALVNAVRNAHPREDRVLCLFPDASYEFWGSILTQVPKEDITGNKPIHEWDHEPLAFLSGVFRGAQLRWGVPDKEGFAIKESCARLSHLLVRRGGFRMFTDHRNLRYIFNPVGVVSQVSKPQADRLERWAVYLRCFEYTIEHIAGELNVWADMLSRWAPGTQQHLEQRERTRDTARSEIPERAAAVTLRVRSDRILTEAGHVENRRLAAAPRVPADEQWPTRVEISRAHRDITAEERETWRLQSRAGVLYRDGRLFVPDGHNKLRHRIMVVSHAGAAGHRRWAASLRLLTDRFWWPTLKEDLRMFLSQCLLCGKTATGLPVPRPFGKALRGSRPGEALHLDYFSLKEAVTADKGLLVMKDGFSAFIWLWECQAFDSVVTEEAVIAWCATFGVPSLLITDGGSHFDNTLVTAICKRFCARHHITTAYAPWANGAIERVMRELVRLYRTLLAESNIAITEWPRLTPVVQSTLNQIPSDARGGHSPAKIMLARSTPRPLDTIAVGGLDEEAAADAARMDLHELCSRYVREAAAAVHECWLRVESAQQRRQAANATQREREVAGRRRQPAQFQIGDYVLVLCMVPRNKLRVRWLGPSRVVDTVNSNVYVVEDLLTSKQTTVHAQRLRPFAEADFEVTEDVRNSVAYDSQFYVDDILDWRENDAGSIELRVRWLGFESNEDTWEPVERLHEDVPTLVTRFLRNITTECLQADELLHRWGAAGQERNVHRRPGRGRGRGGRGARGGRGRGKRGRRRGAHRGRGRGRGRVQ